jgi:hypothetical protein
MVLADPKIVFNAVHSHSCLSCMVCSVLLSV